MVEVNLYQEKIKEVDSFLNFMVVYNEISIFVDFFKKSNVNLFLILKIFINNHFDFIYIRGNFLDYMNNENNKRKEVDYMF